MTAARAAMVASPASLPAIDWALPWLAPYRDAGQRVSARLRSGHTVAEALNAELARRPVDLAAGPLRFVPQQALPSGVAYEAHIHATGQVPTRNNRHDLFNGLVWLSFPRLKRQLNGLQADQLKAHGVGAHRGAVRDALTLFDENAAWLQAPVELGDALRQGDWRALFIDHRHVWERASLTLFGHALLEKLCMPRKPITAHAWIVQPDPASAEQGAVEVDPEAWLCTALTPQRLAARSHHPLPVLGVPGWWAANENPDFYADAAVFRAARASGMATPACLALPQLRP